jgi:lipid II:glycine glycyltransferase (peptidoglycan interpeptide bridge formation enzyme)
VNKNTKFSSARVTIEIDDIAKQAWDELIKSFNDASIYQSWAYGAVRWGQKNCSHIVMKSNGQPLAAAQVRLFTMPIVGPYAAYVSRGPLWRRKGTAKDYNILRQILRCLYKEYVEKRKCLLRVNLNETESESIEKQLKVEGFRRQLYAPKDHTIQLSLDSSLPELKKGLHKRWREKLRRAERNGLCLLEDNGLDLYDEFIKLYCELRERKRFRSGADIYQFRRVQQYLPDYFKMKILLFTYKEKPVSGLVYSNIGDTGIPIFSATGHEGLKLYGSYWLRWTMLERLKEDGCHILDQGGVDKQSNSGSYKFKAGMGGHEVIRIASFEAANNNLIKYINDNIERAKSSSRKIAGLFSRI